MLIYIKNSLALNLLILDKNKKTLPFSGKVIQSLNH